MNIYKINPQHYDITKIGRLVGHDTLVTAIGSVKKTAMVLSIDDSGNFKVWDIRSLRCVQTIDLGKRLVNSILDIQ